MDGEDEAKDITANQEEDNLSSVALIGGASFRTRSDSEIVKRGFSVRRV